MKVDEFYLRYGYYMVINIIIYLLELGIGAMASYIRSSYNNQFKFILNYKFHKFFKNKFTAFRKVVKDFLIKINLN